MKLKNGYYLGRDSKGFFIWNEKDLKVLIAKDLQQAIKESEKYEKQSN